jgi:hypothetical protein
MIIIIRPKCFRCKKSKPEGLNNFVEDPALQSLGSGMQSHWQEVIDPNSYQM